MPTRTPIRHTPGDVSPREREEPMAQQTRTPNPLHTPPIPVQVKLAAAWTSFMFLYIYVDYFHLYTPGALAEILAGVVFEFEIGEPFVVAGIALVALPALMILLSATLPAPVNRVVNLVVAALYLPVTVYNAVGESWYVFYGLTIGLEVLLLAVILRSAWTWPRTPALPAGTAPSDVRQAA